MNIKLPLISSYEAGAVLQCETGFSKAEKKDKFLGSREAENSTHGSLQAGEDKMDLVEAQGGGVPASGICRGAATNVYVSNEKLVSVHN